MIGQGPSAAFVNGLAGFVANDQLFNDRTTLNTFSQPSKAYPGFGGTVSFDLPHRGIISEIELVTLLTVTQTHGTGTTALTDLAKALSVFSQMNLSVDGTPLELAHGVAFQARLQAATRNAPQPQDVIPFTPSTSGAASWELHHIIPVAYDDDSLHGALFSQSDSIYATLGLTAEAQANLFAITGNDTITVSGTIQPFIRTYDVPFVDNNGQRVGVLPESLPTIHRMLEYSVPMVGTGDTTLYLPEVPGQIQRLFIWADNTAGALIDPASWSGVKFTYSETETPLNYNPVGALLTENARHYRGRVGAYGSNTGKVAVLDFAASNVRNALYPANVTRPNVVVTVPGTVTVNAGARLYVAAEWLEGVV